MLNLSVETANTYSTLATVFLIISSIVVAGCTFLIWESGRTIKRHTDNRISENELEASKANERAAKANEKAAGANERAARANEHAEQLAIEAEEARLETEKIKRELAWRRLTQEQIEHISKELQGLRIEIKIDYMANNPESYWFAKDIKNALTLAGLEATASALLDTRPLMGLIIEGPNEIVDQIGKPFQDLKIPISGYHGQVELRIIVGAKPRPK
jgi:hypothetical protein